MLHRVFSPDSRSPCSSCAFAVDRGEADLAIAAGGAAGGAADSCAPEKVATHNETTTRACGSSKRRSVRLWSIPAPPLTVLQRLIKLDFALGVFASRVATIGHCQLVMNVVSVRARLNAAFQAQDRAFRVALLQL